MTRKILVILAHPVAASFCGALTDAYVQGAAESRAEVRKLVLADMKFDALRTAGQSEEPDISSARDAIRWAEHLVFVYPIIWSTIPALLKGFIERTFVPGFAVNFRKNSPLWDKLLKGRSAHLIVTMNTPPLVYRWLFHAVGHRTMKSGILRFCGINPVRITEIGPMQRASEDQRQRWLEKVRKAGRALA